jgi:hypothetical protein
MEGFDAQAISGQNEPALLGIPKSQSEHSSQMVQKTICMIFVEVDDHFNI